MSNNVLSSPHSYKERLLYLCFVYSVYANEDVTGSSRGLVVQYSHHTWRIASVAI